CPTNTRWIRISGQSPTGKDRTVRLLVTVGIAIVRGGPSTRSGSRRTHPAVFQSAWRAGAGPTAVPPVAGVLRAIPLHRRRRTWTRLRSDRTFRRRSWADLGRIPAAAWALFLPVSSRHRAASGRCARLFRKARHRWLASDTSATPGKQPQWAAVVASDG